MAVGLAWSLRRSAHARAKNARRTHSHVARSRADTSPPDFHARTHPASGARRHPRPSPWRAAARESRTKVRWRHDGLTRRIIDERDGGTTMEPDPLISPPKGGGVPRHMGDNGHVHSDSSKACKTGPSMVLSCVLCLVCFSSVVYNGWREFVLMDRLDVLEQRVAFLEGKPLGGLGGLVERYRKDVESRLRQRMTREVAVQRTFMEGLRRTARDVPECVCPAGRWRRVRDDFDPWNDQIVINSMLEIRTKTKEAPIVFVQFRKSFWAIISYF